MQNWGSQGAQEHAERPYPSNPGNIDETLAHCPWSSIASQRSRAKSGQQGAQERTEQPLKSIHFPLRFVEFPLKFLTESFCNASGKNFFNPKEKNFLTQKLKKRKNFNLKLLKIFKKIQLPLEYKKRKSTHIIKNNFTENSVRVGIKNILKKIL